MLSGGQALSPDEVDSMIGGYVYGYLHVSPEGLVKTDGIMLVGRVQPKDKPVLVNCSGYNAADILDVIKDFIRG